MNLELELTKGKGFARFEVRLDKRRQCLKLPALDIDLEDVDVLVTIAGHQGLEGKHLMLSL